MTPSSCRRRTRRDRWTGDPHGVGKGTIGDAGVGVQGGQNPPVDVIEGDGLNILRFSGRTGTLDDVCSAMNES